MAGNTMDAIKKKMQAMKLEKENAMEQSEEMEQKLQEQKDANEKVSVVTSSRLMTSLCFHQT